MGKKKHRRNATPGSPITIEDANPQLAERLRKYEAMASGSGRKGGQGLSFNPLAFHRPGSHKK